MERPHSMLVSCPCTKAQLARADFQDWAAALGETRGHLHRKVWEYCYIAQALAERGMLAPGRRGLGFAVGQEALASAFAARGASITATDLAVDEAKASGWVDTGQHAASLAALNRKGICEPDAFRERVSFRVVDMRRIPADLQAYDFLWSSCALEHLGSLALGEQFVVDSLRCLRPGGVAVHTTEYNVRSDDRTLETGPTVLYRRRDLEGLARRLRDGGHDIEVDFGEGDAPEDQVVDRPPYTHALTLKLEVMGFVVTSFGLIVRKRG